MSQVMVPFEENAHRQRARGEFQISVDYLTPEDDDVAIAGWYVLNSSGYPCSEAFADRGTALLHQETLEAELFQQNEAAAAPGP